MRYHALAADYDGTLAHHGVIDDATWAALRRLKSSGRKLVMVTGRELTELLGLLPHPELFERIVAENGAVIYQPKTKQIRTVAPGPPAAFVAELQRRGVERIAVGRVIVATWEPHQDTVLHVIHDMGLELQVIFNKGAVMVLPSGINKATGLKAVLVELGLSVHNVVSIGDAENDHAMLTATECAVAVANALPALKQISDIVTHGHHGRGVAELIDRMIADDLVGSAARLKRHCVLLGKAGEREVSIDPYASNILVCGTSGSGKSTVTTGLLERLADAGYQFAIIDPEGDYATLDIAVALGGASRPPLIEEIVHVMKDTDVNLAINLLGVAVEHRPEFFAELLPTLAEMRQRTGRPHWLVVDEAHHLMPSTLDSAAVIRLRPHGTLFVTVHPGAVARPILEMVNTVLIVGAHPARTLQEFAAVTGLAPPSMPAIEQLAPGHVILWKIGSEPVEVVTEKPRMERTRHSRKYIEGNLGVERSFTFRGPTGRLNLKAYNLYLFLHLGDGVDDDTWLFHLRNGEYSTWLRKQLKDRVLADEVAGIERDAQLSAEASRAAVRAAVAKRYTLPADEPSGMIIDILD